MTFKKNRFCIFSTQRTGSSWLVSLLNSHPQIRVFNEPFLYSGYRPFWKEGGLPSFHEFQSRYKTARPMTTFRYINAMHAFADEFTSTGFKLMYNQLAQFPEIYLKLIQNHYRMIHLVRHNVLDAYLSELTARKTRRYHSKKPAESPMIYVDTNNILKRLDKIRLKVRIAGRVISLTGMPVREISYESLLYRKNQTLDDILLFIGIKDCSENLTSRYQKLGKEGHYREKIENYDAVLQALKGSRYEVMIREED